MEVESRIPEKIGDLWSTLKSEVVWVHGRWIIYRQLYGTSEERVALLNRCGATFFHILQIVLLQDVQLSLSKLGDPARTGSRKNMTVDFLVEQLKAAQQTAVVDKVLPLVTAFDTSCEKLRHRRNKSIAHFDLNTMLRTKVTPLEGPSRDEIENALEALRNVMNCIEQHYTGSTMAYELFLMSDDGEAVIGMLRRGIRYEQLVRDGVVPHHDLLEAFAVDKTAD